MLYAVFWIVCSFVMFVVDATCDHKMDAYSSIGIVIDLYMSTYFQLRIVVCIETCTQTYKQLFLQQRTAYTLNSLRSSDAIYLRKEYVPY